MSRLSAMRDRLPPVWNAEDGTLLHSILALLATFLQAYDEDMDRVQRSHWVDTAFDMADLVRIGALYGVAPAPWESETLYRARLKATVAARLRGAVSRDVLEFVLSAILGGAQAATGSRYAALPVAAGRGAATFHTGPDGPPDRPAFIEFPPRRARSDDLRANGALRRPLARITATNRGLFPVPLQGAIRGLAGDRTAVPLIANLTNGRVMVFAGLIQAGRTLLLGVDEDGDLRATLDGRDVRDRIFAGEGFAPGPGFRPVVPDPDPSPLLLERGDNELWVFPLALFDRPGLDSAVFAMPSEKLRHGRWVDKYGLPEGIVFGDALFEQPPAFSFDLWWDEATPATFRIDIPAGVVRREAGADLSAPAERARLFALLQDTLSDLRAAGVDGRVAPRPFRSRQGLGDRVTVLDPARLAETQPQTSRLAGLSALFDLSAVDGARFE